MAPVLKTGEVKASVGSNPTPSVFPTEASPGASASFKTAATGLWGTTAAIDTLIPGRRRFDSRADAIPMAYEPGTSACRVLIDSKAQLELMLLNLAKLENTESIRQQLVAVYNQLEELHDQRRLERGSDLAPALL